MSFLVMKTAQIAFLLLLTIPVKVMQTTEYETRQKMGYTSKSNPHSVTADR